jgi:hypothetical protein
LTADVRSTNSLNERYGLFSTVIHEGGMIASGGNNSTFSMWGNRRMAIEKKKNLLIPLNNPRRPPLWVRILIAILRPPLLVLGFIFGNLYNLCFGWHDKRLARQGEHCFADDIRRYLPFLFSEHGATVIPNEGVPFPPSFDGAYVTIAVENLRLRFIRGRGDFSVRVASAFAPNDWEDFRLVADGISQWDVSQNGPRYYTLETFEPILRSRLERLQEALSKERFEATVNNAVKTHNSSVDEYAGTFRQSGIIPKIY